MTARKRQPYADKTKVPADRTISETKRLATSHGAMDFLSGEQTEPRSIVVQFRMQDRVVRFVIRGKDRMQRNISESEINRRWRVLLLLIKAKLTAVADNVAEFEEVFLGNIVDPGTDCTFSEMLRPAFAQSDEQRWLNGRPEPMLMIANQLALPAPKPRDEDDDDDVIDAEVL